jgi:prepilin-type N-terminal cleavage/methylation domain-containing protein
MYKIIIALITAFSLTELMIVVAIAAFIAAIAIPNYKVYVNKATVSQMISTIDPCQVQVYQYFLQNATFPAAGTVACYGQTLPSAISASTTPYASPLKNGVSAAYNTGTDGSGNPYGQFQLQANVTASTGNIANVYIRLGQSAATSVGGGDITYICGTLSSDANAMPTNYLPASCNTVISS